jgi:tetratricopeptide (TPR) repeat protein
MDENRQVCQQLLQSFLDTGYKSFADRATYAYVSGEVPASSAKQLVAAAETVTDQFVGNERILGACLYRAGQYEKALQAFEESHRKFNPGAWDYCFLAMLHEKLRNHEKAGKMLAQARDAHRPATSLWYAKVETDALIAEATSLIEGKASTSSD